MHKVQRSLFFPFPLPQTFFHEDPYDDGGHHGDAEAERVHVATVGEADDEECRKICCKGCKKGEDRFHRSILNHNRAPCIYALQPSCFTLSLFGK